MKASERRPPYDWVVVCKGKVSLRVPKAYAQCKEPTGAIVLVPPGNPGIYIRLNFHNDLDGLPGKPADFAVQFVKDEAKAKGQDLVQQGNKIFFTESMQTKDGGVIKFWSLAVGNSLFLLSATVLDDPKDPSAVEECLNKVLPAIIDSLRED